MSRFTLDCEDGINEAGWNRAMQDIDEPDDCPHCTDGRVLPHAGRLICTACHTEITR